MFARITQSSVICAGYFSNHIVKNAQRPFVSVTIIF